MKRFLLLLAFVGCVSMYSCSCDSDGLNEESSQTVNITNLSVMSFNIKNSNETGTNAWDNRKAACLAMINEVKPNLIGMQEVTPAQKSFFDSNLSDYKSLGVARDGSTSSEYSVIYYRTDIFSVESSSTFWLSATPDFMSKGWDGACYRICTWAKLKIKCSGKELYYFNTHVDHLGTVAQKQSIILLKERISKIAGDNAMVFLTGDFNMQPTNANMVSMTEYMNDTRVQFPNGEFYSSGTYNGWGSSSTIIDYIWYRNATPVSYKVLRDAYSGVTYISDHYPIIGVFSL
jgi:endonuclease/exonuclease/phosphatase family metal-dependent hydrolase